MNEWKCGSSVSCSKWECGGTVDGDPNWKLPQLLSWWRLSASLTSGSGLWRASAGSSKPGTPSHDWFSELDYSQTLTASSCSNWEHPHITSTTHGRQSLLTKKCKVGILNPTVIPDCSLGQLPVVQTEEYKGSLLTGFPFQMSPWEGLYSCSWMEGFSVDLNYQGFPVSPDSALLLAVLWMVLVHHALWFPQVCASKKPWSILGDGCRSKLPALKKQNNKNTTEKNP